MDGRVTVLGAGGFVGSRLCEELDRRAWAHSAPDTRDREALERWLASESDLGVVFYCIGLTADYTRRPFDTVEAHTSLVSRILSRGNFRRIVYLSSTRLYDTLPAGTYAEDTPLRFNPTSPREVYDLSKCLGEWLCLNAAGGRGVVARLSCVYDERAGATGFLPDLLRRLPLERSFTLDSATGYVRDYVHSGDVVAALLAMGAKGGGIYNVASGRNVSNGEIAAALDRLGWAIGLSRETTVQVSPVAEVTRLVGELGVRPRSLLDALSAYVEEIRS